VRSPDSLATASGKKHFVCQAQDVPSSWDSFWNSTAACGSDFTFKVLTFQLYWEKFHIGMMGGDFDLSSKLFYEKGPFDLIAFQECDDAISILRKAGLNSSYKAIRAPNGLAIAYKKATWEELEHGAEEVAEDKAQPGAVNPMDRKWGGHFGLRAVAWIRLKHSASGKVVFFANTHGPLPMGTGGRCGEEATVHSLLKAFSSRAQASDLKILAGDLNAGPDSRTQQLLGKRMHRVATDGVDAVFGSCGSPDSYGASKNWGHNALEAEFKL
jgi:endonuclease/exonuclease/phosphatase family metal-dependent hydrolase